MQLHVDDWSTPLRVKASQLSAPQKSVFFVGLWRFEIRSRFGGFGLCVSYLSLRDELWNFRIQTLWVTTMMIVII